MMNLKDYVIPEPGSFVCPVVESRNLRVWDMLRIVWTVVCARQVNYPGPWRQYDLLLFGDNRLLTLDIEQRSFHENWNVLHRP